MLVTYGRRVQNNFFLLSKMFSCELREKKVGL